MSKVHCKRVINLVFNASNTIFANAPGKNHWLRRKETETTLRDSIWKVNDNREKKNSQWPFHALCKSLALHPRCNLVNINITN